MFHKINSVAAMPNYRICVRFWDGTTKVYDVEPLFEKWPVFQTIKEEFEEATVDAGGYGVIWNDDVDLSCDEIWENGIVVHTKFDKLLSFTDASELWGLNESTLRKAVAYGKFLNGVDVCKFGKQWLVTTGAMKREYGELEGE